MNISTGCVLYKQSSNLRSAAHIHFQSSSLRLCSPALMLNVTSQRCCMQSRRFVSSILLCLFIFAAATAASAQSTFVYTANALAGGSISIYKLNTTTGALTPTGGSPFQDDSPAYLASTASGKFLVVSGGSCPGCGLQIFSIDPTTGALSFANAFEQIGSVLFGVGQLANDLPGTTIYTSGTVQSAGVIDALHVNPSGALTQIGTPFS